jgi:hypothetical protein
MSQSSCAVCGKKQQDSNIFIEVNLELFPRYARENNRLEDMNGLWKKTREFFCEECFMKYAETLENFYQMNRPKK